MIPASNRHGGSAATRPCAAQHLDLARSDRAAASTTTSGRLFRIRYPAHADAAGRARRRGAMQQGPAATACSPEKGHQFVMRRRSGGTYSPTRWRRRGASVYAARSTRVVEPYTNRGGQLGPRVRTNVLPSSIESAADRPGVFGVDADPIVSRRFARISMSLSPSRQGAQHRVVASEVTRGAAWRTAVAQYRNTGRFAFAPDKEGMESGFAPIDYRTGRITMRRMATAVSRIASPGILLRKRAAPGDHRPLAAAAPVASSAAPWTGASCSWS